MRARREVEEEEARSHAMQAMDLAHRHRAWLGITALAHKLWFLRGQVAVDREVGAGRMDGFTAAREAMYLGSALQAVEGFQRKEMVDQRRAIGQQDQGGGLWMTALQPAGLQTHRVH